MGSINATAKFDRTFREVCECTGRPARIFDLEKFSYGNCRVNPYSRCDRASKAPAQMGRGSILAGLEAASYQAFEATNLEVVERLVTFFSSLERESLVAIYINSRGRYVLDETIAWGDDRSICGNFRAIITRALDLGISGIVLAHNHPSGSLMPSPDDLSFTRSLAALCRPLDLVLVDHLIVAKNRVLSMKKAGLP